MVLIINKSFEFTTCTLDAIRIFPVHECTSSLFLKIMGFSAGLWPYTL